MHTEALHMSQISCSTELCWGYLNLIVTPAGPRLSAVPCLSDRKEITTPLPFFIVTSVLPPPNAKAAWLAAYVPAKSEALYKL